jgi:two-component system phosphate regulon sensor histidine kinase PhoR
MLALAVNTWYASRSLRVFQEEKVGTDLLHGANILVSEFDAVDVTTDKAFVADRCRRFGEMTRTRVTFILPDGTVIGDSEMDPSRMENHANRPEVIEAMNGEIGRSVRFSDTIRRTLMYLAVPLRRDGAIVGVVRTSVPMSVVDWSIRSVRRQFIFGGAIVACLFSAAAFLLARQISRPIEEMRRTATRLADGDLGARVKLPDGHEMRSLAQTINRMAEQLGDRMETVTRQRDEQRAVFSSMVEGVVAVDADSRIMSLNPAASRLLQIGQEQAVGRSIQEAVRNPDLQAFISSLLNGGASEAEVTVYGDRETVLQLRGAPLASAKGSPMGAVLVLDDVTQTRRLETMRRDFVANVSHELKTPITALKGCVETLAGTLREGDTDTARFVAMMDRHVDRLGRIVEDLLSLSRLEHGAENEGMMREQGSLCEVVGRSVQAMTPAAAKKNMTITLQCPANLRVPMNAALMEQAVGNLIDNAVKYSGEGTRIGVDVNAGPETAEISVSDQGPGIEGRHLPRVFERFYRVDQARSRSLGGTGLGLSIVRHIALAHGGSVSVDSIPGKGSTFRIRIPVR